MRYPTLYEQESSRRIVDVFKGYNHNLRVGDGEFYDMQNMTSDHYPILSPRGKRGVYASPDNPQGLIAKDALCYIDGRHFVMNEYRVDLQLSEEEEDCPKQLISMGAYVIIMPDKKYINTMDLTDFGNIEASYTTIADVTFELCNISGELFSGVVLSSAEPTDPANMDLWMDTSSVPHTLKKYSSSTNVWVSVATTYIRISSSGIGRAFEQYDGVTISGILNDDLQTLNNTMVVWEKGDDFIVVVGIIDQMAVQTTEDGAITVTRTMPNLDFITESENRLWGCRYGVAANGEVVNEIYACKLGDFKNWNCFMGLSTDSYAASCGTDGQFTGAITHLGYPLFFKEDCVHKVYGNFPSNYQIQTTVCRGVQKGSHNSLAIVNETLYYKSRNGICAYDGSLPVEMSYALGNEVYSDAVGGAHGNKYYVSMKDLSDEWHLFVYDAAKDLWHKEDSLRADTFCSCGNEMYCIEYETKDIVTLLGSGIESTEDVVWMAETGVLYLSYPDMKYISRMTVRMSLGIGAECSIYAKYDEDAEWVPLYSVTGTSLRSFPVSIRPRRCDHMRLRFEGVGAAKIYTVTNTIEQGSDVS